MFKRRTPLGWKDKVREAIWPEMGWPRALQYWRHRVFRTGDSSYRITAGLASGAAASWNPFLGTHIVQAFALSWLLRGNLVAAFVGTGIGLPPFLPFLFWRSWHVGVWVLRLFGIHRFTHLPPDLTWEYLLHHPVTLLLPMALGGYICGFLCWFAVFAVFYYPVRIARRLYLKQRHRQRLQKRAAQKEAAL
jgi:uncharacterized protein (DUF2062 family)